MNIMNVGEQALVFVSTHSASNFATNLCDFCGITKHQKEHSNI